MDKVEPTATVIPSIKCRYCKGDHWSAKCPLKDILQDKINETSAKETAAAVASGGSSNQAYKVKIKNFQSLIIIKFQISNLSHHQ